MTLYLEGPDTVLERGQMIFLLTWLVLGRGRYFYWLDWSSEGAHYIFIDRISPRKGQMILYWLKWSSEGVGDIVLTWMVLVRGRWYWWYCIDLNGPRKVQVIFYCLDWSSEGAGDILLSWLVLERGRWCCIGLNSPRKGQVIFYCLDWSLVYLAYILRSCKQELWVKQLLCQEHGGGHKRVFGYSTFHKSQIQFSSLDNISTLKFILNIVWKIRGPTLLVGGESG